MERDHVDEILEQWARERPDLDASPIGLIGRLHRLADVLNVELRTVFAEEGLGDGDFDVLVTLRRHGAPYELTPSELGASTMVTSSRGDQADRPPRTRGSRHAHRQRGRRPLPPDPPHRGRPGARRPADGPARRQRARLVSGLTAANGPSSPTCSAAGASPSTGRPRQARLVAVGGRPHRGWVVRLTAPLVAVGGRPGGGRVSPASPSCWGWDRCGRSRHGRGR